VLSFNEPFDKRLYRFLKDVTPLRDEQIQKICNENGGLKPAYVEGKFCNHCEKFSQCDHFPAMKAKGLPFPEQNIASKMMNSMMKLILMRLIFEAMLASDDDDFDDNFENDEPSSEIDIESLLRGTNQE
jgi:hypothetical protein